MDLPRLFIGSSTEGLEIANHLQLELEYDAECTVWRQGTFAPSGDTLDSLVDAARKNDFAALVLTPDDMLTKREKQTRSPRDNVLFELGLFMGTLGRERTFIVYCRDEPIELPSDMAGVTPVTFAKRSDGNLQAALGPVCTKLKKAMGTHGDRLASRPVHQLLGRLMVLHYVNEHELAHLRTLEGRAPFKYERTVSFQSELRRLRDLGLIRNLPDHTVANMPPKGNAREHVEITEEGRAYLATRSRLERNASAIEFSEIEPKATGV